MFVAFDLLAAEESNLKLCSEASTSPSRRRNAAMHPWRGSPCPSSSAGSSVPTPPSKDAPTPPAHRKGMSQKQFDGCSTDQTLHLRRTDFDRAGRQHDEKSVSVYIFKKPKQKVHFSWMPPPAFRACGTDVYIEATPFVSSCSSAASLRGVNRAALHMHPCLCRDMRGPDEEPHPCQICSELSKTQQKSTSSFVEKSQMTIASSKTKHIKLSTRMRVSAPLAALVSSRVTYSTRAEASCGGVQCLGRAASTGPAVEAFSAAAAAFPACISCATGYKIAQTEGKGRPECMSRTCRHDSDAGSLMKRHDKELLRQRDWPRS